LDLGRRRPFAAACDPATLNPATDRPEEALRGLWRSRLSSDAVGNLAAAMRRRRRPMADSFGDLVWLGYCAR
jgi:hypothetical protein